MTQSNAGMRSGKSTHLPADPVQDPYRASRKAAGTLQCPECQALCSQGRWTWQAPADDVEVKQELCPACRRIRDHYPGGLLTLSGPFFEAHQDEILSLISNTEQREKQEHPLQRIMSRTRQDGKLVIAFTDTHLARSVGVAVQNAWKGDFTLDYGEDRNFLRVTWHR